MLLCILTGGNIDLAVGSVVCFAGGAGAIIMENKLPWGLAGDSNARNGFAYRYVAGGSG